MLHVKYPLFLSDFTQTWTLSKDFRKVLKYQISRKFVQWEQSCSTRTRGHTWRSQQSHFAILRHTPKNALLSLLLQAVVASGRSSTSEKPMTEQRRPYRYLGFSTHRKWIAYTQLQPMVVVPLVRFTAEPPHEDDIILQKLRGHLIMTFATWKLYHLSPYSSALPRNFVRGGGV